MQQVSARVACSLTGTTQKGRRGRKTSSQGVLKLATDTGTHSHARLTLPPKLLACGGLDPTPSPPEMVSGERAYVIQASTAQETSPQG